MQHRIVILCGPGLTHKNSCATLIRGGLNVAGICMANQRTMGLPLTYLKKVARKRGLGVTISRVLARLLYQFRNRRQDRRIFARLFDEQAIGDTLRNWKGEWHQTTSYSNAATLEWLQRMEPDILVVHTPYWVGKKVRNLPKLKIVMGGHPGLTPYYRGSHSAFWAIYQGKPEDVACTVFLIDEGVDTGEIVTQKYLDIEPGDSFMTLAWKGMIEVAKMQTAVLQDFDRGIEIPRRRLPVPPDSEFDNPTLREYLAYMRRQTAVR